MIVFIFLEVTNELSVIENERPILQGKDKKKLNCRAQDIELLGYFKLKTAPLVTRNWAQVKLLLLDNKELDQGFPSEWPRGPTKGAETLQLSIYKSIFYHLYAV